MRVLCFWMCGVLALGCGARSSLREGSGGASGVGGAPAGGSGGSAGSGAGGAGAGDTTGSGAGGAGGEALSVVDACVIAASCGRGDTWNALTPSTCVDGFARLGWRFDPPGWLPDPVLAQRLLDCAAGPPGDCEAFRACFGGDWVALERCREGGACVGNTVSASIEGPSFDCGSLGATCADLWSDAQRACCNAEPCSQTTGVECQGTVATYCGYWGERVTFDCGPSGRTCNAGAADLWTPCIGDEPCDPSAPVACEGQVAVYCSGGGLAKYDCATTGFRTACNGGAPSTDPACRPAGTDCDPTWEPSTCEGNAIRVCVNGKWTTADCTALGFATCEEPATGARCVPAGG